MSSIEQQAEDHYIRMDEEFNDWFTSDEIRCDFVKACEVLKDKIPQVIGTGTLQEAYFWKQKPINNESSSDDLPF